MSTSSAIVCDYSFLKSPLISSIIKRFHHTLKLNTVCTDSTDLYYTKDHAEILIILSGEGGITLEGKSTIVKTGDLIRIPKNKVRTVSNVSNDNLLIISINH